MSALLGQALVQFRDIPIKQKLMVIIVFTTAAALLMSGLGIVVADSILFHGYLQRDLSTFARIIASNTTAALAFDDSQVASETLYALREREHIVAACLYRVDGTVLATYIRSGESLQCPSPDPRLEVRSSSDGILITRPVILRDRRVGTLVLLYELTEIPQRVRLYGATVILVLLISSVIAFLLSSRLRTTIATPILDLAQTTAAVSETKDYSIRATKLSGDEIGLLVKAFNEMLSGIQARDIELRKSLAAQQEALQKLAILYADLKRSNDNLARSNEDLERFAFVASHDLQEPLRMITIYSQLLVKQYPAGTDAQIDTYVERVVGGAKRMRELLGDLLAYTEIAATHEQQFQTVHLNLVLEKVLQNLKISIEETGAVITSDPLPDITAHEGHLIPLLKNLIANAIKYRGAEPPRVHISVEHLDQRFRFAIKDNGMGIEKQYHSRIFMAFKRLHGKDIPGTGIGLAICQRIVERYGGRIWVESELGSGSTFFFTLPDQPSKGASDERATSSHSIG